MFQRKDVFTLNANIFSKLCFLNAFYSKRNLKTIQSAHFTTLVGIAQKAHNHEQGDFTRCPAQYHVSFEDIT